MTEKQQNISSKSKNGSTGNAENSPVLPPFYVSAALINSGAHGKLKVSTATNFAFAKQANSIVLAAAEFAEAAAHYPIVFGRSEEGIVAHAITGHTTGENLYIDEDGMWRPDTYIPAYVRRYPFLLLENKEEDELSLVADLESDMLGEEEGQALYEGEEPTEAAQQALQFCLTFHRELLNSAKLFHQISDAELLVERSADVKLPDERQSRIAGFLVIDEEKLRDLGDDIFLELRKTGALTLIYCHLWSMRSWGNLLG